MTSRLGTENPQTLFTVYEQSAALFMTMLLCVRNFYFYFSPENINCTVYIQLGAFFRKFHLWYIQYSCYGFLASRSCLFLYQYVNLMTV
jgi:hypothetical protein